MPRNWMKQLRQRLARTPNRKAIRQVSRNAESLELRTYLSVTSLFVNGELQILSDANDDIVVDADTAGTGLVRVTVNGSPDSTLPAIQPSLVEAITILGSDSDNLIDVSGVTAASFTFVNATTSVGVQISVDGNDGNDTIIGSLDLGGTLNGGNGADTITGLDGADSIDGGDGADSITAGAGNDTVTGDDGNDTIDGGSGDDLVDAGNGADSVTGDTGNDTINSGDGADVVDGGDGNDLINGMSGEDSLNGGVGADSLFGGSENDVLDGGDGDDFLNGQAGDDTANGGTGNDTALGGGGKDSLLGGDGDDILNGQSGNDTLAGEFGMDRIYGGSGNDSLDGGEGDDTLRGHSGNDTLLGAFGRDSIEGDSGNDLILSTQTVGGFATLPSPAVPVQPTPQTPPPTGTIDLVPSTVLAVPDSPTYITSGDVDGDGDLDAAIISRGTGEFSIIVNDGLGNFTVAQTIPLTPLSTPQGILSVELADVTGDGIVDLVIGNNPGNVATPMANVQIFANDGTGAFTQTDSVATDVTPLSIVVADLDGDGDSDIATANFNTNTTTVLFNNGAGTFGGRMDLVSNPDAFANPQTVSASDVDQDGDIDLVVSTRFVGVSLLRNRGDGTFDPFVVTTVMNVAELRGATTADIDNDGDEDIAAVTTAGTVELLTNDGSGIYSQTGTLMIPFNGSRIRAADFNRDGGNDLIVTSVDGLSAASLQNDNAGGYLPAVVYSLAGQPGGMANGGENELTVGDFDGNLVLDVLVTNARADNVQLLAQLPQDPIANDDLAETGQGIPITIDIVSNDQDPDGVVDYSSVVIQSLPGNGAVVNLGNGLVTYSPNSGFVGNDSFTYTVIDNRGRTSPPAMVTITVVSVDLDGDILNGGSGDDTIIGGAGDDTLNGNSGNDSLVGNDGDDSIRGGTGNDTLNGSTGNDTLDGQGGDDLLDGGDGNDVISWMGLGDGDDIVTMDDGGDTLLVSGDESDETFSIGQTDNTLVVREGSASISVTAMGIAPGVENVVLNTAGGDDTITIASVDQVGFLSISVNGGNDDDTITATGASLGRVKLSLNGDTGNDTITGSAEGDTIHGGDGDDMISGDAGNDTLRGGLGNDVLSGGNDDDLLEGEDGNDTLQGDAGNDSLLGSFGNDVLLGGDGDDTARGGFGSDALNGMAGNDSLFGDGDSDRIAGGSGDDTIDGGRDDDTIQGHSGNDLIDGNHGDDFIRGQAGDDTILGDDGDDTIAGDDGRDLIFGQDGDDVIDGNGASDTIVGGDGADILRGGGSNDTILGEQGDDTINGGSGTDLASTGEGADTVNDVEIIDESFTLPAALLSGLDT